jgi:hypothetical protein
LAREGPGAFLKIKNGTKARGIEMNLRKPVLYVKKNLGLDLGQLKQGLSEFLA